MARAVGSEDRVRTMTFDFRDRVVLVTGVGRPGQIGNAVAQGADLNYIDMLGFQYEEHTLYSRVTDPKKPPKEQLVSFGIMGRVYGPKTVSKATGTPKPAGPIDVRALHPLCCHVRIDLRRGKTGMAEKRLH